MILDITKYSLLLFKCDVLPNYLTLHSLYTTVRYKSQPINTLSQETNGFKIWSEDKNIYLIMPKEKIENLLPLYEFNHNNSKIKIKYVKSDECYFDKEIEKFNLNNLKLGDTGSVEGIINYAVHFQEANSNKLCCPINFNGKFKHNTKKITLDYLSRQTGLEIDERIADTVELARFEKINTLHRSNDNPLDMKNKQTLINNNLFYFTIKAPIVNIEKYQSLLFSSVGKRKSYGFGSLFYNS